MTSKIFLPSITIGMIGFFFFPLQTNAQITLNYSNFLVAPDITYSYKGAGGRIKTPATGSNQIWDYSSLKHDTSGDATDTYIPESNPAYTDCRRQRQSSRFFSAGFIAPVAGHEKDDASGFINIGYSADRIAFSLKDSTGGINDSIILLKQDNINEGGTARAAIPYPNTYGDKWVYLRIENWHLQLSIASLGLDHAEYTEKLIIRQDRENVGWGKVRVPAANGAAPYQQCLLQKNVYTETDSFFVNGQPASKAVLKILGVQQGGVFIYYAYNFKRKGTEQAILGFSMLDKNFRYVSSGVYDDALYDIDLGTKVKMCVSGQNSDVLYANNTANKALLQNGATLGYCSGSLQEKISDGKLSMPVSFSIYPNPSAAYFTLQIPSAAESATVIVYDLAGRKMETYTGVKGQLTLGNKLAKGIYIVDVIVSGKKQTTKISKL